MKIGRRLARVGAVALKNSVYVLPRTDGAIEDFQWVRREIVAGGGEATVAEAELVDGLSDEEVEAKFREARDADYSELVREVRELATPFRRRKNLDESERATLLENVHRLERRLQEITATDFFGASGRETASGLLSELRAKADPPKAPDNTPSKRPQPMRGRVWVTRTGIHVDRIASAWIIRRFIDPEATFEFVAPKGYAPSNGELRFDMFEAEYSHEGDDCTFETLLRRFDLGEPGLRAVAEVVHDIDLKESKFGRAETAGVAAAITGLCRAYRDDNERLERGTVIFESLLAFYATKKEGA
ncbi:MAG TPA: chromate resistance protein ChrB domain-containing protein [Polyangiaceae bacterium]|nr:chromate resistance protein ChrB domain-containing protein [Polyangiaceae bacterium]